MKSKTLRTLLVSALAGCTATDQTAPGSPPEDGDVATDPDDSVDAGFAIARPPAAGVYVLGNPDLKNLELLDDPNVDGYALRTGWTDLDHGTAGGGPSYDFSTVAAALAAAQARGKRITLAIEAQLVPDDVLAGANTTYLTTVPVEEHNVITTDTPVTWDPPTLIAYRAMLDALASDMVCLSGTTCSAANRVAIKSHPALAGIRVNIIGMGKLRQDSRNDDSTIFSVPGYDRSTFVNAVVANVAAVRQRFPGVSIWVPYFVVNDTASGTTQNPTLDAVLVPALQANGSVGLFQELLKGDSPPVTGGNGKNLLAGNAAGGYTAFQACGGWVNGSLCTFKPEDTTPENGFALAAGSYGARYYEFYAGDIMTTAFAAAYARWRPYFLDPASAPNPVALAVTRPSATRARLSWTDTSTLETGVVVERRALPSGAWEVRAGSLSPNTVFYSDTITSGTSYAYRVHAESGAGPLVMSAEVTSNP